MVLARGPSDTRGGRLRLAIVGRLEGEESIDVWEPGKRLRWIEEWGSDGETVVDSHVETHEGKTFVRLVHSGFSASAD